ncbi:MAG: relaxase/mobilization nuclease domain-containing protein, partial [Mailhella sp.]
MIVKIWPIKADYAGQKGKVGGIEGLKNSIEYITDDAKTIIKEENIDDMFTEEAMDMLEGSYINTDADFTRVIRYMANEDKIKGKYISGYLCDPDTAIDDFNAVRVWLGENAKGNVAYHLVQSFPEELNISDEEVHQCGIELCERLGQHQAIICSHVHPALDEKGELHGSCKHNHILFNAYIHPSKLDPKRPGHVKYHDCKESYQQLQIWNDEIAIDHGLPIIRNPDHQKTYSWKESDAINKGYSWKERIRLDIETARKVTFCWNEFVAFMKGNGYEVKDGKQVTYIAPDKKHRARDATLGREFTRESLECYWKLREEVMESIQTDLQDNASPSLLDLSKQNNLSVSVPLGKQGQQKKNFYHLPLARNDIGKEALYSYFEHQKLYDICNEEGQAIAAATGAELISFYQERDSDRERNKRAVEEQEQYQEEEEERRRNQKENEEDKEYYTYPLFLNSRTKKPYRIRFYDKHGRPISSLEAVFILAIVVLRKEDGLWLPTTVPPDKMNDVCYAKTDWKVQNMLDALRIAEEEGIEKPADIDIRLDKAGAAYSRAKASLRRNTHVKEKMEDLHSA